MWETTWLASRYSPLIEMLLICQISFIFILSLYDQVGWHAYRDLAFRSQMGRIKNDINTSASPARRKLYECVCTNLNWQRVKLIFIRGYEHESRLMRWNRLYINTKIYYPAYWASPPIGILFLYKHPPRK